MAGPTLATIKRLFAVSGNRCAFPGCTRPLVTEGTVTGEVCHIEAQSANGPRYDPRQTDRQRHGFENLILMCPSHHKVIDADPETYTVERLLEIKAQHEARYAGSPEPSDEIARHFLTLPPYQPPSPPGPDDPPPDPGPLPPGFRLPFRHNPLFTGRTEPLKTLARALLHPYSPPPRAGEGAGVGATLVTQAVQGLGGVGKTQLAVEFAHRYGRFFHGVHWIDGALPEGIGSEVAACGEAMCLPNWPPEQPEQVALTLRTWQQSGPRLVILDNLENVAAAREWLARLGGGPLRLLLTARRSDWPPDLGLAPLPLELFTPQESRAFLRAFRGDAPPEALDALAERLGRLPLALELAGRYLAAHPRLSIADYLERLEAIWEHPSMAGWREDLGSPTGHDLDLAATFGLSWERVEEESACRLFLAAGYCAPNRPIPCELLERAAGLDRETCDEALFILSGLGLLEMGESEDEDEAGAGPLIHPLLAEYARSITPRSPDGEGVLPALAAGLARLAREANDRMDQTGDLSHFVPLLPHVRPVALAAEATVAEEAASLWNSLGYHRNMVADYAGARAAFERALGIWEAALGPEHPQVATGVNNLGLVLNALGDLAGARVAYERALAIDEAAFGPDHPNVARDVNNLGGVLKALGNLAGARAAFERVLGILDKTLPPEHPYVAATINNLGSVLQGLGDLAGARAAYERALAIDEAAFGPDHPNVAICVNNLGEVLRVLGDLAGARAAYERALGIWEAALGPEHPQVATGVNNLGLVLQALGDLVGARAAFERALAILENSQLPPDHPYIKSVRGKLESLR